MENKQHYVVGFMFDEPMRQVVLIEKQSGPECVIGKWNGIGGKVDMGVPHIAEQDDVVGRPNCNCGCRAPEKPRHAMAREFLEETGLETSPADWTYFCELTGEDFVVYFFWARDNRLLQCVSKTDERVMVMPITMAMRGDVPLCPNLNWMLPFLLDRTLSKGFVKVTATYEKNEPTTSVQT